MDEKYKKFIWPLDKITCDTKYHSQLFGDVWVNKRKLHTGIDIAVIVGSLVFSSSSGEVVRIGNLGIDKSGNDWGKYIIIQHNLGDYCTGYLHIDPKVVHGDKIVAGVVIGKTAKIKHPHLHFQVWKDTYNNPVTHRGALPKNEYAGKIGPFFTDTSFPSNFVDPLSFNYDYATEFIEIIKKKNLFMRDLHKGCTPNLDVKLLQQLLNKDNDTCIAKSGAGSIGNETNFFLTLTENAVQRFQIKYRVVINKSDKGYGYVGPKTKAKLQELYGS